MCELPCRERRKSATKGRRSANTEVIKRGTSRRPRTGNLYQFKGKVRASREERGFHWEKNGSEEITPRSRQEKRRADGGMILKSWGRSKVKRRQRKIFVENGMAADFV